MDCHLLNAKQVVSGCCARGDGDAVARSHLPATAGELGSDFLDLGPAAAAVGLAGVGDLAQVAVCC